MLDIPLAINGGLAEIGDFDAEDVASAQTIWLEQTNAILLDDDLANDVSYVSHELSNDQAERITTVSVAGVEPGQSYELTLLLFGNEGQVVQISPMGRSAFYGGTSRIALTEARTVSTANFVAVEDTARFAIRNYNPTGMVRMLAVRVQRAD
ncbi:hypothetical protein [Hyphobacterium marinum]|uniref:DUF642 domain-containing protein n=1 Tax=Hyphobacterium marinum TaxID=3116574 RepID=A0ABU7LY26_9PROT|nr:hypothetical protein [Hyphobacterium sp. Y6023]MEE2566451.1 hypothetical protein [Hyphobacterium sp. Y6023]